MSKQNNFLIKWTYFIKISEWQQFNSIISGILDKTVLVKKKFELFNETVNVAVRVAEEHVTQVKMITYTCSSITNHLYDDFC